MAFVTNLAPYYRQPLFRLLAERMDTTFFFFGGDEGYLGSSIAHEPEQLPTADLKRVFIAGQPLLVGLDAAFAAGAFDVVIKCINGRLVLPQTFAAARRRRLPFVLWSGVWMHPRTVAHRLSRPLVHSIYRHSDAIVTYGSHVADFLVSTAGVQRERLFVAGQAVDVTSFAARPSVRADPPDLLFVGRLEKAKGILDLLAAFQSLPQPDITLTVIGDGPLRHAVRRAAAIDNRIRFVGPVAHLHVATYMGSATCLALPSITTATFREPWGLVVNEAMAAGLPVIATRAVGAAAGGLVQDGSNGWIVPEGRPDTLAAAIHASLTDRPRSSAFGEQGRRDVAAFSYERMYQAFADAVRFALR